MSMRTKKPWPLGRLEDPPQVVDRGGAIDVEPELRELQRQVALDARRHHLLDDRAGSRASPRRPAPASPRSRRGSRATAEAAGAEGAGGLDRLVGGLAGDEAPGEAAVGGACRSARPAAAADAAPARPWKKAFDAASNISACGGRGRQQVLDRPGVVAEHVAIADAEPALVADDDAARFERLGGVVDGFGGRLHAEVGAGGARAGRSWRRCGSAVRLGDRRPHRGGDERRRQHLAAAARCARIIRWPSSSTDVRDSAS